MAPIYTWRAALAVVLVALVLTVAATHPGRASTPTPGHETQHAGTPAADATADHAARHGSDPCAAATPTSMTDMLASATGTPMAGMAGMDMGTPMAGMAAGLEFDQLYIDMMIPHHAAIIAMAQAAVTRLHDERLRGIAEAIIAAQGPEIEELRGYRAQWYGSPDPAPMDQGLMGAMSEMMPGMGSMEAMMSQMDPAAQVARICAAADSDLAFIDLTIAHHEMAIVASQTALTRAVHPEIRDFAQRVIDDQQREIAEVQAIRADQDGTEGTPMASPAAESHTAHQ